jgi:ABC-type lipoprotein release transport system permease subunit
MTDNNVLREEEQQWFSNWFMEINKGLLKQIRLLERINIYLIILIILVILGFVGYVWIHLPCIHL